MPPDAEALDSGIELYRTLILEDARLQAEFRSSARAFFGREAHAPGVERLAERRHLEWFLLERPSVSLRRVPIEALEERWQQSAGPALRDCGRALRDSLASVFEVTGVEQGRGLWLRDLAAYGEYPIDEPAASALIERGDLIVGRLFPMGDSVYRISPAAGFFRNPALRDALRRDFERARAERRGVLRIAQSELESMFWGSRAPQPVGSGDPVRVALRALIEEGIEPAQAEAILGELAAAPFDPEQPVVGGGEVLGAILDRLAFDTSIDLERAREVLLRAWPALAPGVAQREPAEMHARQRLDVAEAVAAFDRGRANGADLDQLFDALERDLALDAEREAPPETGPDEGASAAVPDFPGVVGAMVEEYLWETGHERGREAQLDAELLRSFGRFGAAVGVFENLRARDLLVFTSYWLPESGELATADQARALLSALKGFCRWAEEKQGVGLFSAFRATFERLRSSLPRVVEANRRRTREADRSLGELYECLPGENGRIHRLRDASGAEHDVALDAWIADWLQPGDRLRARRLPDGRVAIYCCYPPEIAGIEDELRRR